MMPEGNEDLWFEDEDDGEPDAEPSPEPTEDPLKPIAAGVLGASALRELLGLSEGGAKLKERKRSEQDKEYAEKIVKEAANLAKEKSVKEVNELYVTVLTARVMVAHCPDCMEQLKQAMIDTIKDLPIASVIKYKEKYGIQGES
jgi:hypothetical protein